MNELKDTRRPTTSRIIAKKEFQTILRDLRQANFIVTKLRSGYSVVFGNTEVLRAMQGTRNYLVRFDNKLFM